MCSKKGNVNLKKRQRKKNENKYLPIYADEFNLLTMTEDEQKQAWNDYLKFREQHAYCKTYRRLKEFKQNNKRKMVFYQFPVGKKTSDFLQEISSIGRRKPMQSITQSLSEQEKEKVQDILNKK